MRDSKLKRKLVAAYEVFYEARRVAVLRTMYRLQIMNSAQTLRYIAKHKCSVARYGDGELDLMTGDRDLVFQAKNEELVKRLKKVMGNRNKNLLVCVPYCLNSVRGCNDHAREFWIEWGRRNEHHKKVVSMIKECSGGHRMFGDNLMTRPYIDWVDEHRAEKAFPMLKSLWEGEDVLIVEGEKTRLGIGNDLFDGASSIKRILAPAIGAFDHYEEILQTIMNHYHGELILLALGPTATVLASDLADRKMRTLDIGNIDIEYEWFLRGAKERVAIPGKFTTETTDGRNVSACNDEIYMQQIIAKVNA